MLISIVIPVYKSSATLFQLAERIDAVFAELAETDYEIVFVNDSPFWAETRDALQVLARDNRRITAIELTKNFGQQPATLCGIEYARGDYIVTMDDDLQHAPEDIPKFLEKASHDVVIARFRAKEHSLFKRTMSKLKGYFDFIILGKPRGLVLSPYRLFKAPIGKFMLQRNTPYPFIPALLFEITDDVINVDADHHARKDGSSHYTLAKMLQLFSNLIINNSALLLRVVGYAGFVIAAVSFVYAVLIVVRAILYEYAVAGWASTIASILFFGGMILVTLGMVGEYLVRIIATSEQRPTYYVRKVFMTPMDQRDS